jgi:2-oxoglutarate dehydrogenase complex dehydrogenase (E1) component-like enzyme
MLLMLLYEWRRAGADDMDWPAARQAGMYRRANKKKAPEALFS